MGSSAVSAGRLRSVTTIILSRTAAGSPATRSRICFLQSSHTFSFGAQVLGSLFLCCEKPCNLHTLAMWNKECFLQNQLMRPEWEHHSDSRHSSDTDAT